MSELRELAFVREPVEGRRGSPLFEPLELRGVRFRNRVMVSPMCQYTSIDGLASDWHEVHLGARALGGAALVMTEATAVEPRGRIGPQDLGIWSDAHTVPLRRVAAIVARHGAVPGIQLAHAGRKASTNVPWERAKQPLISIGQGGWETVGPSAIPFGPGVPSPRALTQTEIAGTVEAFAAAARRARDAGFRVLEIHAAHGYLLHSFMSPIANQRTDEYGGSWENRTRFAIEVVDAVRAEWPAELPLFVRLSSTDWVNDRPSWTLEDTIRLTRLLGPRGVDLIDCSSGGIAPGIPIREAAGYQVPFAEAVKRESGLRTAAVGLITEPEQAEEIIANGRADLVALARAMLDDPNWALHAARHLGATIAWPSQYLRARHTGRS